MHEITQQRIFLWIAVLSVVLFDTFVVSGWLLSCVGLAWGGYLSLPPKVNPVRMTNVRNACLITFIATTLAGYSSQLFVKADISDFAKRRQTPPVDKAEALNSGKIQLCWLTKWSLLSYSNVDRVAIAKLRTFPYSITEYDFNKKKFVYRQYD